MLAHLDGAGPSVHQTIDEVCMVLAWLAHALRALVCNSCFDVGQPQREVLLCADKRTRLPEQADDYARSMHTLPEHVRGHVVGYAQEVPVACGLPDISSNNVDDALAPATTGDEAHHILQTDGVVPAAFNLCQNSIVRSGFRLFETGRSRPPAQAPRRTWKASFV